MPTWIAKLREPLFTEMVRPRGLAIALVAVAAAQVASTMIFHLGLPCIFHESTHLPCPGCGLTRSLVALCRGQFSYSFSLHPFGYVMLGGLLLCVVSAVAPGKWRSAMLNKLELFESRTTISMVLLLLFVLLWIVRLTGILPLAEI